MCCYPFLQDLGLTNALTTRDRAVSATPTTAGKPSNDRCVPRGNSLHTPWRRFGHPVHLQSPVELCAAGWRNRRRHRVRSTRGHNFSPTNSHQQQSVRRIICLSLQPARRCHGRTCGRAAVRREDWQLHYDEETPTAVSLHRRLTGTAAAQGLYKFAIVEAQAQWQCWQCSCHGRIGRTTGGPRPARQARSAAAACYGLW